MRILLLLIAASLSAHISGRSQTNTSISDVNEHLEGDVSWSAATNHIQLGIIRPHYPPRNAPYKLGILVYLRSTNKNVIHSLIPPPRGYRLDLILLDADGKPVKRTSKGDSFCKPLTLATKRKAFSAWEERGYGLMPGIPRQFEDAIELLKCFKVKEPGTYTLVVRARLYRLVSYPEIEQMILPETSMNVTITQADLDNQ